MNALQHIQQKLKVPKSQYNSFGNYSFRNCEDILEAVKPFLVETNSTLIVPDSLIEIGGFVFVEASAILTEYDDIGAIKSKWVCTAYAKHSVDIKGMHDSQISGATSSYARKYALNGLFLIDDTKDSDSTNDSAKNDKKEDKKLKIDKPTTHKKEWLNPGTPQWDYTKERILSEGLNIEGVKKFFLISKANEVKLFNETKN